MTPRLRHPLYYARTARLWSQPKLARWARVALRTVVSIENRHAVPRLDTRKKLLDALGLPLNNHRDIFGPLPNEGDPNGDSSQTNGP